MKKRLDDIFENLIGVEYDTKCVLEMMNDYKDLCCVNTMEEWERRMTVFTKTIATIHKELQDSLTELDNFLLEMPDDLKMPGDEE